MTITEQLGRNITATRESREMSKGEMARRLGVDRRMVTNWERGRHRPKDETLRRIAELFGVSVASLFADDGA